MKKEVGLLSVNDNFSLIDVEKWNRREIFLNPELHPGDEKPHLSLQFGFLIPKSNQNRFF